jgi:LysR family transcriptional regulator for bpeEF and oprC
MDKLAALQFFVRVVESGSFSQAARELGVGQPAVSKQIAALEQRLGAQLLNRTSRKLRPTPVGVDFYDDAIRMLHAMEEAENRVANGHVRASGPVRVAAPPMLTSMMIVPALPDFFDRFPEVAVEFVVSERYADLIQEGLDMALRVGTLDSSGLFARKIGSMRFATLASAAYLARRGVPLHPSELDRHQLIANRYLGEMSDWRFTNSQTDVIKLARARFSCNNPADMHAAVMAGLGVAQSASGLFDKEIRSGQVVEILNDFTPQSLPIHVLYNSARIPQRVRAVSDFLIRCMEDQPSLRIEQSIPSGNRS